MAKSTLRLYDQALRKFSEIVGDKPLRLVGPYDVECFTSKRLKEVSQTKVSIDFRTLKAAFNRAIRYGMIETNPFKACTNVRVSERIPEYLSKEEFARLINCTKDRQLRSMVVVAVCTAMRLGEIVHLHWDDVDLISRQIRLKHRDEFPLKTRKGRNIPLNNLAYSIICAQDRSSKFVFPGTNGVPYSKGWISKKFKRCVRNAGLSEGIHFHSLRHTGASWLVQSGVPLSYVKEILGHADISTTMIYAHSNSEQLRESVSAIDRILGDIGDPNNPGT